MIASGSRSCNARSRSSARPFLAPLDDALRQPVVQRQRQPLLSSGPRRPVAEVRRKRRHRVLAPVPDQVFGQFTLFLGDAGVTLHHLRVDDGHVQAGLRAVVQEHRVEHLAASSRQPKGHVGYPQHRLGLGQRLLDHPHAFDGLRRRTHVVFVAGSGRKHQGIKDDVFCGHSVLLGQQLVRTVGDLQLPLSRDRLRLVGIIVDASHHQRRAVAPRQRDHALEAFLPILQVDGVDDGLALQPFQRLLDHRRVRRVDHDRGLDAPVELVQELDHVRRLVPVRVLQAHVQHVGAVANLPAANLGRFLKPFTGDQALEPAAAQHIGPFPDHRRDACPR